MSVLSFTVTAGGINILLDGRFRAVPSGAVNFAALKAALKEYASLKKAGDNLSKVLDTIRGCVDIPTFIAASTFGRVQIGQGASGNYEVRFDGEEVRSVISERLIEMVTEGFDIEPLALFLDRVMNNPLATARDELYLFIESGQFVLTPDGHFLAFKKVRSDYKDIHSGTFDNSVGQVCVMDRDKVDPDRFRTCSAGLHFCSYSYLPHFGGSFNNKIMIVKIDPADVVAIPNDYSNAKGRTWRYVVVGEVPEGTDTKTFFNNVVVTDEYDANDPTFVDSDPEDYESWDNGDDDDDDDVELAFSTSDGRTFLASTIQEALDKADGNQRAAARALGVARSTLWGWLGKINATS